MWWQNLKLWWLSRNLDEIGIIQDRLISDQNLTREQLHDYAKQLAHHQEIDKSDNRVYKTLVKNLELNYLTLEKIQDDFNKTLLTEKSLLPSSADWLLDNYYVVKEQIFITKKDLNYRFYKDLYKYKSGVFKSYPRVFVIAWELLNHTDYRLDKELLEEFILDYETVTPLTSAELWSLPIMLRLVLIENLKVLMEISHGTMERRKKALAVSNKFINSPESQESQIRQLLGKYFYSERKPDTGFLIWLLRTLKDQDAKVAPVIRWLELYIQQEDLNLEEIVKVENQKQARSRVSVGNIISSLRLLTSLDWQSFFDSTSLVEKILLTDPAAVYSEMDFQSRDRYRHIIENLSRYSLFNEQEVARRVIKLGEDYQGKSRHVGFYLLEKGLAELKTNLDYRPPAFTAFLDFVKDRPAVWYIGTFSFITFCITIAVSKLFQHYGLPAYFSLFSLLVATAPASIFTNSLFTSFFPPLVPPKLKLAKGIPPAAKTLVVMPCFISSLEEVTALLDKIEKIYLSNREDNLFFALLADFPDSKTETLPSDQVNLDHAHQGILALNTKYDHKENDLFYFFCRNRTWNPQEKLWMGWERKRGKIEDLNTFLSGQISQRLSHITGLQEKLRDIRYVISLDVDTQVPFGVLKKLVGTALHPLNQPVIDPKLNKVVEGYGIIQPRVDINAPAAIKSLFTRLNTGNTGLDPYHSIVSNVYQDLFSNSLYIGKALYDVRAFHQVLTGRFRENTLLSHDLLEGLFLRVALATDIIFLEDFPKTYRSFSLRQHRWIRGDWQFFPMLFARVLTTGDKWKLFDNLRRSLLPVSALTMVFAGTYLPPAAVSNWLLICFLLAYYQLFTIWLVDLSAYLKHETGLNLLLAIFEKTTIFLKRLLLSISFLPFEGLRNLHAILQSTSCRLFKLPGVLQWSTAASQESGSQPVFTDYLKYMFSASLLGFVFEYLWLTRGLPITPGFILLTLIWLVSPVLGYLVSRPEKRLIEELDSEDRDYLLAIAKKIWQFFDDSAGPANNYLPSDNIQFFPQKKHAQRTSPTNIGFLLLSIVCAKELGFITLEDSLFRLGKIFETLDKLPKFKGHLFNWYQTDSLTILHPGYISTVDSGNLAACLIVLRQSLLDWDDSENQKSLVKKTEKLLSGMDFSFLYFSDPKAFTIGFNVDENRADDSYYNLLASEARIASLVAIALKQVPDIHWFSLGRPLKKIKGKATLLSWGGTMFEYFMPGIFVKNVENTILDQTCTQVLDRQIQFAAEKRIPWGISESGFSALDFQYNYQYQQFGVPDLSLKMELTENLVVSPYSSFLALSDRPKTVIANLKALEKLNMSGDYGFYEALDFNKTRTANIDTGGVVKSFMAHHQGMSLAAITNSLLAGILRNRFHHHELIASIELLLAEKIPLFTSKEDFTPEILPQIAREAYPVEEVFKYTGKLDTIRTTVLSNSEYSVVVTNNGIGYSAWKHLDLTRWATDATDNNWGWFLFIKDLSEQKLWSATFQPYLKKPDKYSFSFYPFKADFNRTDGKIDTKTSVYVSPDNNVEVREVILINNGTAKKRLELTDYMEIVGLKHRDDSFHPALGKLFIDNQFIESKNVLLYHRRPKNVEDKGIWIWHAIRNFSQKDLNLTYETDKTNFIGRGRTILAAEAFDSPLTNFSGVSLDPIASLRTKITIKPQEQIKFFYLTGVADTRALALEMIDRYSDRSEVERIFKLTEIHSQIELRHLGITGEEAKIYQKFGSRIIYPDLSTRASPDILAKNQKGQSGLYAYGISGDYPLVLMKIKNREDLRMVRQALLAHEYLRMKNIIFDLVIQSVNSSIYQAALHESIVNMIDTSLSHPLFNKPGGIFLKDSSSISNIDQILFDTVARMVLDCSLGNLDDAMNLLPRKVPVSKSYEKDYRIKPAKSLKKPQSYGQFTASGSQYQITTDGPNVTPLPWSNVIATENFGTLVTANTLGFTWSENSQLNRLTPWHNNPQSERPGEGLYIYDLQASSWTSATPIPNPQGEKYISTHGFGYSTYASAQAGLKFETTVWVDSEDPVKLIRLKISNPGPKDKKLGSLYFAEMVMGDTRQHNQFYITSSFDPELNTLTARNNFNEIFPGKLTFLASSIKPTGFSGDRTEFLGQGGNFTQPYYLEEKIPSGLSKKTGAGLDPALILENRLVIPGRGYQEITYLLGQVANSDELKNLLNKYTAGENISLSLEKAKLFWQSKLARVQIRTPDSSLNTLANGWLAYQNLSGRFWGRTSFYQSGGAFGFRDQLQDAIGLLHLDSQIARNHILVAASHQFIQGDVMHWWHPKSRRGVRTRISDDFLWLPWAVSAYIDFSHDTAILDQPLSYMDMTPLTENEMEKYDEALITQEKSSLYIHCLRALENGMKTGKHGLPLIGSGDWNDGLNNLGRQNVGESIWLAWFQIYVYKKFSEICKLRDDLSNADRYLKYARDLEKNVNKSGWDGGWYLRAFADDGKPVGSKDNTEGVIDSISQTWAVISGAGETDKIKIAFDNVEKQLIRDKDNLLLLLSPPYNNTSPAPGYIQGYNPGIRENGAQYTHAGMWLPLAYLKLQNPDRAVQLLDMLNPINLTDTPAKVNVYKGEPYVLAGDVYSHPQHTGHAGWTWYTGSAGWMYKVIIEDLLGLKKRGDTLYFEPIVPSAWTDFSINYTYYATRYEITFTNPHKVKSGINQISLDGHFLKSSKITLVNDLKAHIVQVIMG